MAQKKCPKCGEDNPAEAVMCWACYTPLSGAATAPAGGGAAAVAAPMPGSKLGKMAGAGGAAPAVEGDKKEKLKLEPKQIGIVAAVFVGLALAVIVNLPKKSEEEEPNSPAAQTSTPSTPTTPGTPAPAIPSSPITSSGSGTMPAVINLPYTTVVPPNSRFPVGTMAILPATTPVNQKQAAGLAVFAKSQFIGMKKWTGLQIYVFNTALSAQAFQDYVSQRRGAPLTSSDLQALATNNAWTGALVCYEFRAGREVMRYPSSNPNGWWRG